LEKVGFLQARGGDGIAAAASMTEILATRRRIVDLVPDDEAARWQLGDDLERMGNLQMALDEPAAALAAWRENLEIRRVLAEARLGDADRQRRLAGAHANVAFAQLFMRDFAAAETESGRALALFPGEAAFETNLAHALMLRGEIEA